MVSQDFNFHSSNLIINQTKWTCSKSKRLSDILHVMVIMIMCLHSGASKLPEILYVRRLWCHMITSVLHSGFRDCLAFYTLYVYWENDYVFFRRGVFRTLWNSASYGYSDHNNVSYRPYVGVSTRDMGNNRVLPINLKVFNKADIINIVQK